MTISIGNSMICSDIVVICSDTQGGCTGCVRTPPQAPKVRILLRSAVG